MSKTPTFSGVPQGVLGFGDSFDRTASKGVWVALTWAFAAWLVALAGALWYDRPGRVRLLSAVPGEPLTVRAARWFSWFTWTVTVLVLMAIAPASAMSQVDARNPSPLAGVAVFGVTALLYFWHLVNHRRWVAHRAGTDVSFTMVYGDLLLALRHGRLPHNRGEAPFVPGGIWVLVAVNVAPLIGYVSWPAGLVLGYILSGISFVVTAIVMIRATKQRSAFEREDYDLTRQHLRALSVVTGVSIADFDVDTHIHLIPGSDGGFSLAPTPSALAAKFTPARRAEIDSMMAQVMPGWELGEDSDHKITNFYPLSAKRHESRKALAESGGLVISSEAVMEDLGEQVAGELQPSHEIIGGLRVEVAADGAPAAWDGSIDWGQTDAEPLAPEPAKPEQRQAAPAMPARTPTASSMSGLFDEAPPGKKIKVAPGHPTTSMWDKPNN